MSNKKCIVLLGPPCSGKSTAGKATASSMNINYISSGDIAREMAKYDTQIGVDLSNGMMAPEDKMRKHINSKLWNILIHEDQDIVILDGFPRFGDQARWLRDTLPHNIDIHYVMFDVSLSTITERSKCRNRNDDRSFEQRLDYYSGVTFPELCGYVDYYINTENNSIEKCSELLTIYIKEVSNR